MNIAIPETLPLVDDAGCQASFMVTEKLLALAYAYLHARTSVHIKSFEEHFKVLRVLEKVIGKPAADIASGCINDVTHENPEWIPLIEAVYPGLVNLERKLGTDYSINRFFSCDIEGLPAETNLRIKAILGFYPVEKFCTTVRSRVLAHRYADPERSLVDPFTVSTVFTGCVEGAVSCAEFTRFEMPKVGDPQICSLETYRARFSKFTHGIFDTPDFPWENTWIAGGVLKLLYCQCAEIPTSDIDIFVTADNQELLTAKMRQMLLWFESKTDKFGQMTIGSFGAVCNVSFTGIPRTIQIIANVKRNLYGVIQKFDADYCRWACYGWPLVVRASPCAIIALRTRTTSFVRDSTKREERASKALRYGYNLHPSVLSDCSVYIEDLIKNRELLCAAVDRPSHSPNKDEQVAMWLAKHPNTKVTDNTNDAVDGLCLQNINQGYTKQSFVNFDIESLPNEIRGRRGCDTIIKSHMGFAVKLNVEKCTVLNASPYTLRISPPENWQEFIDGVCSRLNLVCATPTTFDISSATIHNTNGSRYQQQIRSEDEIKMSFVLVLSCVDGDRKLVLCAKSIIVTTINGVSAKRPPSESCSETDGSFD